jgi:2-polyprenyl-3-methyl-5-hydroxy-6-metoxy-1,4-benzoquinol methylase
MPGMPGRSKWLDPARIAHGIAWRFQALKAAARAGSGKDRRQPPIPSGDHFTTAVLRSFGVKDIAALGPTERMWAEFRLTSAERGWNAVELLGGPSAFRGKRVLDVGCAYGGFLVAAAHAGAKESVGIDVDPELLDLARLLLSDHQTTADLRTGDITDASLADRIGQFDVVFCNDVLEHILDLRGAAANLAQLLNPGGLLFLEIPNGQAVQYVGSDGHYKLPGITLLEHTAAVRWFRSFYEDAYPYRTYFYAPLDFYVALFSGVGLPLRLLNAPVPDKEAVEGLVQQWAQARERISGLTTEAADKPQDLVEEIQARAGEMNVRFVRLHATATSSPLPEERDLASMILRTTFGLDSFLLEGRKPNS